MLLFIDIDGVMHPVGTHPAGRLSCKPRFEQWAAGHPAVRLVIASSWRRLYPLDVLKGLFSAEIGVRVIGVTPRLYGDPTQRRYREILAWLAKNNCAHEAWFALDDSSTDFPEECSQLVRCVPERGFDDEVAVELERRIANMAECNADNPRHRP